jgi:hypothetical protein
MTNTILNADGSVYMTFPPVTPRVDRVRYTVRHVRSIDNPQSDVYDAGTTALVTTVRDSFRGVLAARNGLTEAYQVGPAVTSAVTYKGRRVYRYTWERLTSWNGRVTDTLWIFKDEDGRS